MKRRHLQRMRDIAHGLQAAVVCTREHTQTHGLRECLQVREACRGSPGGAPAFIRICKQCSSEETIPRTGGWGITGLDTQCVRKE